MEIIRDGKTLKEDFGVFPKFSERLGYDMTPDDKKSNMAYWDDMENDCQQFFDHICKNYAMYKHDNLDEDSKIDISKAIIETIIKKCKDYGLDTDKMFPYVDCNY